MSSRFKSLQERFDYLRGIGFPITMWEEFIQDCLSENKKLKEKVIELEKEIT